MILLGRVFICGASSLVLSGCLTIPAKNSTSGSPPPQGQQAASRDDAASARKSAEDRKRAELSKNDRRVEFRRSCEGLFIPEIKRFMFQGLVPVHSIFVLNNSGYRYSVKYDVTFLEQTRSVLINNSGQFTEEKSFVVRPGTFTRFDVAKQDLGAGRTITGVERIVVLSCDKT